MAVQGRIAYTLVLYFVARVSSDYCNTFGARTPCVGKSDEECAGYGCCWDVKEGLPSCFFQTPNYTVKSIENITLGVRITIEVQGDNSSGKFPGSPISPLQVSLVHETEHRLRVNITDPLNKRWTIPEDILPTPTPQNYNPKVAYGYRLPAVGQNFFISVFRAEDNVTLFDTSHTGFIYANQLLQIGTVFPSSDSIYGFGEHKTRLKLNDGSNYTLTLWNYDGATPNDLNLYGSHPFYLDLKANGSAHGVFLRNSNGMDIDITASSITYNIIGGVLDFYFFLGPEPGEVVTQYQEVIGRPAMPPYWALGYHQSRNGFENLQQVKEVVSKFASNEIPLDAIWTDIDYMNQFKDFTTDPDNFPTDAMASFVNDLHASGQRYVLIVDPVIYNDLDYMPYLHGFRMDVFVRANDDHFFIGKLWPGEIVYVDFAYDMTGDYWHEMLSVFLSEVPVDGVWIGMNEPSNFCNGECIRPNTDRVREASNFDPSTPPYAIGNRRLKGSSNYVPLNYKTLDMDAYYHNVQIEYNMHNLYGYSEAKMTRRTLETIQGKRVFVLSRSTFPGSGAHAGHWLGDNTASSEDLLLGISTILSFQLFGVPLVGADICGYIGPTSEELCARWMEVGSFYPFARNHNNKGEPSQEPYQWASVAAISRKYLAIRYSLLPYYYTLFYQANHSSSVNDFQPSYGMVLHPLFIHFPTDATACGIDSQFMVGGALLIAPQCNIGDGGKSLDVYLPAALWYDWFTLAVVSDGSSAMTLKDLSTPLDYLPIYIRGGHIIPMQGPGLTTVQSRKNPYSLIVALDQYGRAAGSLYLDNGENITTSNYTFIKYSCAGSEVYSEVLGTKYASLAGLPALHTVTVVGLEYKPNSVTLNEDPVTFTFSEVGQQPSVGKLVVDGLSLNMDTELHLNWM